MGLKRHTFVRSIPNILSFIRLGLVPLFVWLFFCVKSLLWAGVVFTAAGMTDVLDGIIARKTGSITRLGRIIDPLADKLMQITAFTCLAIAEIIPAWVILILAAKEFVQLCGGWILLRSFHDVPPSNKFGKAASVVFYFVTISIIIFDMPDTLQITLLCGSLALSILALIAYTRVAQRYTLERQTQIVPEEK